MANKDRLNLTRVATNGLQALGAVEGLIAESTLDKMLVHLVKLRISQINGCVHCIGLHNKEARQDGETQDRLDHIMVWRETDLYTAGERAALAWGEALTTHGTNANLDELHAELRASLSDEDIGTLMLVIVMINTWNRVQIASHSSSF